MIGLINHYVYIFLHPFQIHTQFKKQRAMSMTQAENVIPLLPFGGAFGQDQNGGVTPHEISRTEGIVISWIFAIVMALYELVTINMSLLTYDYFTADNDFSAMLLETYSQNTHGLFIFLTLFNAVIFPLTAYVYLKFWEVMIRFFAQIFSVDDNFEESLDQVLSCSLTSHMLLIIPVFGKMAHYMANLIYLFAGLKNNMGFTTLQSIIILASPMFLMLLIIFLIFFMLFAMFGMM